MPRPGWRPLLPPLLLLLLALVQAASAQDDHGALARAEALHRQWEGSVQQCFPWSQEQSIARDDFEYPDAETGQRSVAEKGDLINMRCDSVVCPNPRVENCYMNDEACKDDEWCMLEDQVRFGPWAMADGETPNFGPAADCERLGREGYAWMYKQVCLNTSHWGPWLAVRGRCVPYRKAQQSCNAYFAPVAPPRRHHHHRQQQQQQQQQRGRWQQRSLLEYHDPSQPQQQHRRRGGDGGGGPREGLASGPAPDLSLDLWPQYVVDEEAGRPPARPLLCGAGLACTGAVEPMAHTCVKARPPNTCYQGPWWDSSWCKVGGADKAKHYPAGLPLAELQAAAAALLIQLPIEVFGGPDQPRFWTSPSAGVARAKAQALLQALWPERYRANTTFPLPVPDPWQHPVSSEAFNSTLADAVRSYRQASKVWSTIHTLIHNARDPLPPAAVRASRALAVWLRQHFMCCNCRGFWANLVLNRVGLPPRSSARLDHARWWWAAHNMVSEHSAASRGGHPWVWLSANSDEEFARYAGQYSPRLTCQNPWFLPWEWAEVMWVIP